ncbi:hypothetical protein GH714_030977 [Hevea brasiliensis]|uniref:Uncharacterized protein n=1 Tax=Hevea brasiliensis TaxID=3981 RepID=A0A6A6LCQ1_HEVBR|nr:hypothetical protein GH714_030977 [Hevea brasiliensis]
MADSSNHAQGGPSLVEQQAGARSKVLAKFMGPSRLREELGNIETRMDKIEDHLVSGDDRFEELESRLRELGEGLEDTRVNSKLHSMKPLTRWPMKHALETLINKKIMASRVVVSYERLDALSFKPCAIDRIVIILYCTG